MSHRQHPSAKWPALSVFRTACPGLLLSAIPAPPSPASCGRRSQAPPPTAGQGVRPAVHHPRRPQGQGRARLIMEAHT